jgi:hypothetical protein
VYPVGETCRILSDYLEDVSNRYEAALSRMASLAGTGTSSFNAALLETQSLRAEYEAIKAELERHKAQHDPASTQD